MFTLITGGAGYIGSHTLLAAIEAGLNPIVVDNFYSGFEAAIPDGVPLCRGSILDAAFLNSVFQKYKISSVMHFAAHLEVEESTRDPIKYYQNNVMGTLELLKACNLAGSVEHFVFSSTCAVYGNPKHLPVSELEHQNPVSPYGRSKLATEMLIKDFCATPTAKMKYVLLRYFNVAGSDPMGRIGQSTPNATQLVKICAEVAAGKRQSIKVFGSDYPTKDGTCIRDYIHVSDLASAHIKALAYLKEGGASDIFNLGYGKGYSVLEIIDAMKSASGIDFAVEYAPRRAGDSYEIYSDTSKSQKILKLEHQHQHIELICKTSYNWEKKQIY